MHASVFAVFLVLNSNYVTGSEPTCSKFHYEEKTLEKMIRQEVEVEKMKSELEHIKHQVKASLADLKNERSEMNVGVEKMVNDVTGMKNEIQDALANMKAQVDESIQVHSAEMEKTKAVLRTPVIAFKAYKTPDKTVADNKIIIFTENLLNMGDAYDNKTGIFVAPVDGIYLFTAQICITNPHWMNFGIFISGRQRSGIRISDKDYNTCSTFDAVTEVLQGEKVLVKCTAYCDNRDRLSDNGNLATSSFTGLLVHKVSN